MATSPQLISATPSNFYLRNPLLLLTSQAPNRPSKDQTILQPSSNLQERLHGKPTDEGQGPASKNMPLTSFFDRNSASHEQILDLNELISTCQAATKGNTNGQGHTTASTTTPPSTSSGAARPTTPYQILFSATFQCYTSLTFYGALLSQLRKWVKRLDASPSSFRALVWSHLFCLVDSTEQSSSAPFAPVLKSITAQPQIPLLDIEVLHLSVLLSLRIFPQLLSYPISNSAVDSAALSSANATTSPTPDANSTVSTSALSTSPSSASTTASSSPAPPKSTENAQPTPPAPSSPSSNVSPHRENASSFVAPTNLSRESFLSSAVSFYQSYRSKLYEMHEDVISMVAAQRRLVMSTLSNSSTAPLLATPPTTPSKTDVMLAMALRQLATLSTWSAKLEALSKEKLDILKNAVQTVPALMALLNTLGSLRESSSSGAPTSSAADAATQSTASTSGPLSQVIAKWNLSPRANVSSISTLFCAVCMLKDFGVLDAQNFVELNFDAVVSAVDASSSSTAASASSVANVANAATAAFLAATKNVKPMPTPTAAYPAAPVIPPSLAVGGSSAHLRGMSNPPLPWGASPLPGWSPVPSPLTFPTPAFGSLSPLTFMTHASPMTFSHVGSSSGSSLAASLLSSSSTSSSSNTSPTATNFMTSPPNVNPNAGMAFGTAFVTPGSAAMGHSLRPTPTLADPKGASPFSPHLNFATSASPSANAANLAATLATGLRHPSAPAASSSAAPPSFSTSHAPFLPTQAPSNSNNNNNNSNSNSNSSSSSTPTSASSGFSPLLGGRSAFGILKRAAEEEAENDLPAKRRKLAE